MIGADGVNSLVRKKIFPNHKPRFLKQVAFRTLIPSKNVPNIFLQDKTLLFLGNGKHAVSYPIKDKAFINFVFCINTENFYEQDWTRKVATSELIKNFSDFITFEGVFEKVSS